jgi:hypothetical protein
VDLVVKASAVDLGIARATIARCWLDGGAIPRTDGTGATSSRLGTITLRPHQISAVDQLRKLLDQAHGALLADEVGLGKTFVALALAREAVRTTVVAPAGLRAMWRQASEETGVAARFVTTEGLSRTGRTTTGSDASDLVIVDEAHHFRNPATQRYRALAQLTVGARVLLVTATPVHNRGDDVAALLGLFLGAGAWKLSDEDRGRLVVRRVHAQLRQSEPARASDAATQPWLGVPAIDGPHALQVSHDTETLNALAALPPPVPPRDGGDCGALVTIALARQWASSTGALRSALRRRLTRAAALAAGLEAGAYPSYGDLREWCVGEGSVQLAFPEMLVPAAPEAELLPALRAHAQAIRCLLESTRRRPDPDVERAERMREILRRHEGQRVVAFSAYEDTVRTLYRLLVSRVRVCGLSAHGGEVAGGHLSRATATAQFAPGYSTRDDPGAAASRIDLLLTTDLLSEGVNLQGASVVVHLDLPWTPARLEQRVGRVARLGSAHARVHVYAMIPPAAAESLLGLERQLRTKLAAAGRAVGIAGSIVPVFMSSPPPATATLSGSERQTGPPEQLAQARAIIGRWLEGCTEGPTLSPSSPVYAAVRGPSPGFLAACVDDGRPALITLIGERVSDSAADIAAAARIAEGEPVPHDDASCQAALRTINDWWAGRQAAHDAGLTGVAGARVRLRVLARIASIYHRAPRHVRPRLTPLVDRARRAALTPCGIGAESVLGQLADAMLPDAAWLRAVGAFGDAYAGSRPAGPQPAPAPMVAGLIVFAPPASPCVDESRDQCEPGSPHGPPSNPVVSTPPSR